MIRKTTSILLASISALAAAGCVQQRAAMDVRSASSETSRLLDVAQAPLPTADKSAIKTHDTVFVGSKSVVNEHGEPLPQRVERPNGITINNGARAISLKEVAEVISSHARIPVVVAADVPLPDPIATAADGAQSAGPQMASGPVPAGFPLDQALQELQAGDAPSSGVITASNPAAETGRMALNFSGKMSDLLDLVAANFNVNWTYERGKIVFRATITRSFDVPALPMATSLSFKLGEEGEDQEASTSTEMNVYEELGGALGKLVGDDAFSINRSTGTVTVTGSPAAVDRARQYIENINARLEDQVALSVKVYSVRVRDSEDFSLDLEGVFKTANTGLTLAGAGTAGAVVGGGSLGWALLDSDSQWVDSGATVKALSQRGDVSVKTTATLTTVNGQPVPLQVGEERDYVKEITVERDTAGGIETTSTTFQTDEVSTGFALQLMPRIQRNGDVLLQYGVNIKELVGEDDGFDERTIGENTVQLKRISQRNFIQNVSIPHGQTLVLAGFEQVKSTTTNSGVGHPLFPLLGGGASASKEREVIVIVITPTVLK